MTELDFSKNSEDDRLLLIIFDNERPVSAAHVAAVLKALDSDYRQMTGRDLVLARMELGSTWLWLVDIAVYAGGALKDTAAATKASAELWVFAKKIRDAIKPKKQIVVSGHEPAALDEGVDKSIMAIAKAAEATNSNVRMRKTVTTSAGVQTIEVEVTPLEAKEARKRMRQRPKTAKKIVDSASQAEDHYEVARTFRELPPMTGELEAVIQAIVQAHVTNGGAYILEQVASTLEAEGRWDIASVIRQNLGGGRGTAHVEN
ncbi:MAG: hypothetical protein Q8K28_06430 [Hoeflea sp.]|uniref:hypothetical protein n=1 Tax=Hoeflea sp. TaxID=1940281 RepID=UPI00272F2EFB|nr:hypothetical protein [Hoeflea sp.]MDP2119524.1 hypothetical protein [Hoeflea sp.]